MYIYISTKLESTCIYQTDIQLNYTLDLFFNSYFHTNNLYTGIIMIVTHKLMEIAVRVLNFCRVSLPGAASRSALRDYEALFQFWTPSKMWEVKIKEGRQYDSMVDVISGREYVCRQCRG